MSLSDAIKSWKAGIVIGEECIKEKMTEIDWQTVSDICIDAVAHEDVLDHAITVGGWSQNIKSLFRGRQS